MTFKALVHLSGAALLIVSVPPAPAGAQGVVSGHVSIQERPGDKTEDLGNTVIYLDLAGGARVKPSPVTKTVALQSRNFSPHVVILPLGSKISFPNQDPFSHNVFTKATQGSFDSDLYGRGKSKDNVFKEPGVYPLYCNVHPRMTAFVIAVKTPYFAQAGADGRFSIEKVPAGRYALHVWHERGGEKVDTVDVQTAGFARNYTLDARNYKYVQHKDKNGKDYVNAGDIY